MSESFFNFVHRTHAEDVAKWEKWIEDHPQHADTVERAILVVRSLRFQADKEDLDAVERQWKQLQDRLHKEAFAYGHRTAATRKLFYFLSAACMVAVLGTGLWFTFWRNSMVVFETDIAQKATLSLPDGSEVTLNRNSSIRYHRSWENDSVRKVWLEGEAYFKVAQREGNSGFKRFEVHAESFVIDVIGTVFHVNTLDGGYVSLESGRIDLRKTGQSWMATLQPGQSAKINATGEIEMSEMTIRPHISWVDDKISLNDNSLKEIIHFIESTYGLVVQCNDEKLLQRKLSGQVKIDNIDDLLSVLEKVLGLVIVKDGQIVKIFEIKKT